MKRAGFSMIELVFIIVILGILSAVAIPRLVMSREDACYAKLRANLSETQSALSREYTKRFMQGKKMQPAELETIFKDYLTSNTSNNCEYRINNANQITAVIGKNSLAMNVTTDIYTKSPSITCDLTNAMCKKLTGKKTTN